MDLEFIPWSPTFGQADAADIVTRAARPNGGVLVDTLHFSRSQSSNSELAGLPSELFNFAQLCDARAPVSNSEAELIRVARSDREPPGEGDIQLKPILGALPTIPYALEVPNDIRRQKLGAKEFSRYVLDRTKEFFHTVENDAAVTAG